MQHDALPLFPLGTVLFPGGLLPLRIFEVRYLDMIGKCHKQGTPFGVVALTQGSEVLRPAQADGAAAPFAPESFHAVGTFAEIDTLESPQPGLLMIRCTGRARFSVRRSEKLRHGLWVADVDQLADDQLVPVPPDLLPVAEALGQLIRNLRTERRIPEDEMPIQGPHQLDDCGWVANRWCELLSLPLAQKQSLMALDNPLLRLELIGDLLARGGVTKAPGR